MADQIIIGLGGRAGSGKSTAAAYLAGLGYTELTFAEPLKEAAARLFGLDREQLYGEAKEQPDRRSGLVPRLALQKLGECCRTLDPGVFVAALRRRLFTVTGPVVVSDVRFGNEAQSLYYLGARLIRLDRPGAGAVGGEPGHASETELDGWTGWQAVICNDGSLYQLYKRLGIFLRINNLPPFQT